MGDLTRQTWVRVLPALPWTEDFENVEVGKNPLHWVWAGSGFRIEEKDGNNVLAKPPAARGLGSLKSLCGAAHALGIHHQADLMGTQNKRRRPDMGLIAHRYILDLQGIHQRLEIRSWSSDLRMAKRIDFAWEMGHLVHRKNES